RATLGRVLTHLREGGGVRTDVAPGRSLVAQTTRAILRRRHATDPGALPEPTPVPAGGLGATPAVYPVTPQGLTAPGEAPPRPAKQRPAPRPVPWRTRVRRLLGRVKRRVLRLSGR